jgi:hypothetical protein
MFGGSLIASIMNLRKRHPTKNRPLIYTKYDRHERWTGNVRVVHSSG